MKKITLTTRQNGKDKTISVYTDEEIARWLEAAGEAAKKDFVLYEKRAEATNRKETRRHISLEEIIENGYNIATDTEEADEILEQKEEVELIRKAIEKLPDEQKVLIMERYFNEKSVVEIAKLYGVSRSAIYSKIRKIIKKMQKFLKTWVTNDNFRGL